jgi:hypothetical protein
LAKPLYSLFAFTYLSDSMSQLTAIKTVIDDKGRSWVIAALIDGSIGYYCPTSADIFIKDLERGETKSFRERSMACFDANALEEFWHDIAYFLRVEETNPDKVKRLVDFVERTLGKLSDSQSMAFSSLYPTHSV